MADPLLPLSGRKRISDISGARFGSLTVTGIAGKRVYTNGMSIYFTCKCDCGEEIVAQRSNILAGKSSCGCNKIKRKTAPRGSSSHHLFKTWSHMIDRCTNPSNKSFRDYGGRGISVCERWTFGEGGATGFECFIHDIGPRPAPGLMLERLDNSNNYTPDNCAWIDRKGQNSNKRSNIIVEIGAQRLTVAEWARRRGISEFTIYRRIGAGWDPVRAIKEPLKRRATRRRKLNAQ
jgi:hypothetical protein